MLAGRESLIRLIGKRKRTLSPNLSLLLYPQDSSTPLEDGNSDSKPSSSYSSLKDSPSNGGSEDGHAARCGDEIYDSDYVSCPVCGRSIRGTDYLVNAHLDSCLTRGTKRKLTQRTLLQLSFCSISSSKTCLDDFNNFKSDAREIRSDDENEPSIAPVLAKYGSIGYNERTECELDSLNHPLTNSKRGTQAPLEDEAIQDTVICKVVDPPSSYLFPSSFKLPKLDACGSRDANSVVKLETFIVGHRFHDNVELQEGASIFVQRDPQNAKDQHAIKVLHADPGCGEMLGYLPRKLAKYMSPLIEKYHIEFEGTVISLPKHSLDAVPIRLVCQKKLVYHTMESSDRHLFDSLWENILRVVEDAKVFPPSTAKYQHNFHVLVQEVLNLHAHLFMSSEKLFLGSFRSLSDDGQRLFIRLYTRKGPWFRMSNISYLEISDAQKAIEELHLAGYISSFQPNEETCKTDMKEVLDVLTVFELREISNLELFKKGTKCVRKPELINLLFSAYEDGRCPQLPNIILERAGTCVKISFTAEILFWRVQRLFFLNGEQDLTAFLLVDLGLVKYPDYTCNFEHPIFNSRSDLLAYEEAVEVAQIMDQSLDENNMEMVMKCIDISDGRVSASFVEETRSAVYNSSGTFLSCFSASWVYSKVLFLGVSFFERERRYEDAERLLKGLLSKIICNSSRGHWTLRLSVDLEHMGRLNESLLVAEEGLLDPWVRAGSKLALQRRVLRLGKPPRRWKIPNFAESVKRKIKEVNIAGRPLTCETGTKNLFYGYDGELCGVEQLALQYYAGEGGGWQGVHSESGIWMTIFGLLMWDVIFANVPNVFRSRFQVAPLDLKTDDFYEARKSLIDAHLQKIYEGMAEEIMITSWESHVGTACQGVNWDRHSLSDLRAVVSCIGGHCLASFCRHLAQDYRSWSSGMPDLLLWRFHGGDRDGGEAKLVEVKGPRDRLSEQQRAWMLLLMDSGFDAELCKAALMDTEDQIRLFLLDRSKRSPSRVMTHKFVRALSSGGE